MLLLLSSVYLYLFQENVTGKCSAYNNVKRSAVVFPFEAEIELFAIPHYFCIIVSSDSTHIFTASVHVYISIGTDWSLWLKVVIPILRTTFQMLVIAIIVLKRYPSTHCLIYVRWSCRHQVRQVGFLRVLRFPPTRRPSERKHRCQRAWCIQVV